VFDTGKHTEKERERESALKMNAMSWCSLQLVLTLTLSVVDLFAAQLHRPIKSTAVTRLGSSVSDAVLEGLRVRRQTGQSLTSIQMTEVVDHHNALRAMEGADNMQLLV